MELSAESIQGSSGLEMDVDGLWICRGCRARLVLPAVGDEIEEHGLLRPLVGKSAGAICRTMNLPYEPPFQPVLDAASAIAYDQDRYMSAWTFANQWLDGTTMWRSACGDAVVFVTPDGAVRIQPVQGA